MRATNPLRVDGMAPLRRETGQGSNTYRLPRARDIVRRHERGITVDSGPEEYARAIYFASATMHIRVRDC